ncbi:MAG: bifunctional glycosyltransferase/class I SAM-dependent methyltransferase [Acidimicrobiia bacterium]|nr:bifunctional glycosyltransferase/class I SAM-dependent methyltransferase [Acidimicrobiia bacterium]
MKRIGILVVTYNAASTLAHVLDRIPEDFRPRITKVLIGDDASQDSTYLVGLGYQQHQEDLPLTVVRHPRNLGYGGNQKAGYRWAIDHDLDIVVLLHGDGQYAPEFLPQIVEPLERDEADAVFGSRMLDEGEARRGGMPMYKYVGNRILTTFENKVVGLDLSEWHSGYRAYSVAALKDIPFDRNDDGFNFDTQIIIQLREASKRIAEVPIPTYYGDEICYVDGMKYARDVSKDVVRYRAHKMGFGTGEMAFADQGYELKESDDTSHVRLMAWLRGRPASRILDLGCSDGSLAALLREHGHTVTGVDIEKIDGVGERVDQFVEADLDHGIPDEVGTGYDIVLAADVLEHVREPGDLMVEIRGRLRLGGSLVTSIPNFAHWYPRARVALGRFDYDRRGILDRGHVRFFTRRSFERIASGAGFDVRRREAVGLPLEVVDRGAGEAGVNEQGGDDHRGASARGGGALGKIDRFGVSVWPNLFAYQYLYELGVLPDADEF